MLQAMNKGKGPMAPTMPEPESVDQAASSTAPSSPPQNALNGGMGRLGQASYAESVTAKFKQRDPATSVFASVDLEAPHVPLTDANSVYLTVDELHSHTLSDTASIVLTLSSAGSTQSIPITRENFSADPAAAIPICVFVHVPLDSRYLLEVSIRDYYTGARYGTAYLNLRNFTSTHSAVVELMDDRQMIFGVLEMRHRLTNTPVSGNVGVHCHYLRYDWDESDAHSPTLLADPRELIPNYDATVTNARSITVSVYKITNVKTPPYNNNCSVEICIGPRDINLPLKSSSYSSRQEDHILEFDQGAAFPYPADGYRYVLFRLMDNNHGKVIAQGQVDLSRIACFRQNVQVGSVTVQAIGPKVFDPSAGKSLPVRLAMGELYYKLSRTYESRSDVKAMLLTDASSPQSSNASPSPSSD